MNRARPPADLPSSGMGNVRLDAAAVRAVAQRVLDGADALDGIRWYTLNPVDLAGSAAGRATDASELADRIADVVAHMRTWAAAAQSATEAVLAADARHAARLWRPR
jgi:hypothetical protein